MLFRSAGLVGRVHLLGPLMLASFMTACGGNSTDEERTRMLVLSEHTQFMAVEQVLSSAFAAFHLPLSLDAMQTLATGDCSQGDPPPDTTDSFELALHNCLTENEHDRLEYHESPHLRHSFISGNGFASVTITSTDEPLRQYADITFDGLQLDERKETIGWSVGPVPKDESDRPAPAYQRFSHSFIELDGDVAFEWIFPEPFWSMSGQSLTFTARHSDALEDLVTGEYTEFFADIDFTIERFDISPITDTMAMTLVSRSEDGILLLDVNADSFPRFRTDDGDCPEISIELLDHEGNILNVYANAMSESILFRINSEDTAEIPCNELRSVIDNIYMDLF
ncbi:hypothetical protein [Isoalcanivorax indicus]|uniref:hypothetical protein n=1 Tax=Isoalcanivorax indicus TaxID=2202653 RepID=UPI000DB9FB43|nr:hypothetical protein [Isoalcanivorax indicus]